MRVIKMCLIVVFGLQMATSCSTAKGGKEGTKLIPRETAVKIATEEVARMGYDIRVMAPPVVSKYDTPWNEYLSKDNEGDYAMERKNKLKNRTYWAVYFAPSAGSGITLGGDVCVFVDAGTGEILADIRGE